MLKRFWSRQASEIALLLVVVLLTAVAISPLLRADQPCTHDGGLHYFRTVAMRHALDDGLLISRWAPDLAFGYGNPFFNYRAAASYYLGLALYLTGLSLPWALNLVYVIALIGSGIGAYLFGRDLFGRRGGLVAAVAYVYAPYSFIDALVRGNMPESVALGLFPFILWAFRRLLLSGQVRYLLFSAGSLALLWLSHNISSLLFTPFLALYLLVVWLARGRREHLVMAGVALALGIGLTAFFWAPAVLEKSEVQLHLSRTARNNDYHYNFIDLAEVFAPTQAADPALLNPPMRLPLGLPLAVLAFLGTFVGLWRWRPAQIQNRERWASVLFFALAGIVMIFMATRASLVLWENVPLIPFVQFPWRFVGRAVLPFSFLAAAFAAALPQHTTRNTQPATGGSFVANITLVATPIIIILLILFALPFTYPPTGYCPAKPQPDILDLFAYEHTTGLVGVDPLGNYFPVTVLSRPSGSPLEEQYAANLSAGYADRAPIARFDTGSLPEGASVHRAEYAPNQARLEIETPSGFRARYLAFAFPGWRVFVDDRQVDVTPSDPEGLITFDIPAGNHSIEVVWGSTLLRALAAMASLVALAGVAFIAYTSVRGHVAHRIRAGSQDSADPSSDAGGSTLASKAYSSQDAFSWGHVAVLALLALVILAFKLRVVDRSGTIFRHSGLGADGTLSSVDVPMDVPFDDSVRLLGYERSAEFMPADGTLHLAVYWSAYARPSRSYRATVALVGPQGRLWSPKTASPRRGYSDLTPSSAWGEGRYAVEGLDVEPMPGTPPGHYDLLLTVFDRETLAPLNVLNDAGQVVGPNMNIGQIELTRPFRPPDPADVPMQNRLEVELGPVALLGVDLDRSRAAPGDPMLLTLFWRAEHLEDRPDLLIRLVLTGQDGAQAMAWDLPPVRPDWPTTLWNPGDVWRGRHLLRLPGGLESGTYGWQLQLYEATNPETRIPETPVDLGQLRVDAPERLWNPPPLQLSLDADLGRQVRLLGANLEPVDVVSTALRPSDVFTTTLVWEARAEMDTSYRVFLHLLRPDGSLLAQSDGEPAGWTRPTTGWAPGEIVLDERVLDIPADAPPGQYGLVAGLYDPDTKERLALPDGTGAVSITSFVIEP